MELTTNKPLVSIIMPVYNTGIIISETIQSILKQTMDNFEFIVIDDSTDGITTPIIAKFNKLDRRIRVVKQTSPTQSLSSALNLGISLSNGKYIVRMDADDIAHPERLAKQIQFMDNNPDIGVCGTFFKMFSENISNVTGTYKTHTKPEHIKIQMLIFGCAVHHPTLIIRRNIFDIYQLTYSEIPPIVAEDHELWIKMINLGVKFANLPEYLLYYRISTTQATIINKSKTFDKLCSLVIEGLKLLFGDKFNKTIINDHINLILKPKSWRFAFKLPQYYKHLKLLKQINQINQIFNQDDFNYIISQYYLVNKLKTRTQNYLIRLSTNNKSKVPH